MTTAPTNRTVCGCCNIHLRLALLVCFTVIKLPQRQLPGRGAIDAPGMMIDPATITAMEMVETLYPAGVIRIVDRNGHDYRAEYPTWNEGAAKLRCLMNLVAG